jgi:predicted phosphate transport protein (TIGR00153 family)
MWRKIFSFPLRGVAEQLRVHMNLVLMSVELLENLIEACEDYNWEAVGSVAERIARLEREADDIKRQVELGLFSGAVFVGLKEDFYKLAEALDDIADKSKDASRAIASRQPDKEEVAVLFEGENNIMKMIKGTVEIVKILMISVELLNKDMKEALQLAHDVEKTEEKLDDIKLDILKNLTRNEKKMSPLSYLQIRDFIFLLDMVADAAEAASDVITAMIVKSGA